MNDMFDTLDDQIANGSFHETSFNELTTELLITDMMTERKLNIPYENLINKYRYFLEDYIVTKELNDDEYRIFKNNPQALSMALYGHIHLWHSLLELNHVVSKINFTKRKIKYYEPSVVDSIINDIKLKEAEVQSINIH